MLFLPGPGLLEQYVVAVIFDRELILVCYRPAAPMARMVDVPVLALPDCLPTAAYPKHWFELK